MRYSTWATIGTAVSYSSADTTHQVTITLPARCSAFYASCKTTLGTLALDGSDQTASGVGHDIPKDQAPMLFLVGGGGNTLTWLSTAGTAAVLHLTPLLD